MHNELRQWRIHRGPSTKPDAQFFNVLKHFRTFWCILPLLWSVIYWLFYVYMYYAVCMLVGSCLPTYMRTAINPETAPPKQKSRYFLELIQFCYVHSVVTLWRVVKWLGLYNEADWRSCYYYSVVSCFLHYSIAKHRFPQLTRSLAVSLHVTRVINPTVGCHYFPPGLQLPSQPLRGLLPVSLLGE